MTLDVLTLKKLHNIAKNLFATRSLETLLPYVIKVSIELVGAERGYLVWCDDDGSLKFRVCLNHEGEEIKCSEQKAIDVILHNVIDRRESQVVAINTKDLELEDLDSATALKLHSAMCVPLISNQSVLGVIFVDKQSITGEFSNDDLVPLEFLASQATVAIENAILNDELERRVSNPMEELERANLQLEQSWREAVEMDRVRSAFFAMVAHDVRSPLATIMFALDLLREATWEELDKTAKDLLDTSIRMTNHVDRLTKDFLDLLSAQIGELTISPELINLEEFMRDQYQINTSMPWSEGVIFQLDLELPLPNVLGDQVRIQQVITNLVSNANKCTHQGSVTLYARYLENEGSVLIGVRDTGIGIAEEDYENIFQRFWRDGELDNKKGGLGLGLAICQELIERHQGRIWVESIPSEGSDFKFTLPVTT